MKAKRGDEVYIYFLDTGGGLNAALPPEMTGYPLHRGLVGLQGRSGWVRKISPTPRFDPRTV